MAMGHRVVRALLAAVLLLGSAACAQPPADTGVQGRVFVGPTCPVQRLDSPCPADFTTSVDGTFRVPLSPGAYVVSKAPNANPLPAGGDQSFTVTRSSYTHITIAFDSGIR